MTAADNAEWLERFKVDAGISKNNGPGLLAMDKWDVRQGGLGLPPPYAFPRGGQPATEAGGSHTAGSGPGGMPIEGAPKLVDRGVSSMSQRYPRPAKVFCSRELEDGLTELVKHKAQCGVFPTDEELKVRARIILRVDRTPAEEPTLLEKFKKMIETELGVTWEQPASQTASALSAEDGMGASAGTSGLGGADKAVDGGLATVDGLAGVEEMPGLEGLDMGMDLSGDLDSALLQDLNFDFVFDTQDAVMGGGMS